MGSYNTDLQKYLASKVDMNNTKNVLDIGYDDGALFRMLKMRNPKIRTFGIEKGDKFGKKVEFYSYPEEKHEFIDQWPFAAERSLQFFDTYVKNVR